MASSPLAGIILAAGKGTRMKSDLPKGLHQVCGMPMVELIARAMKEAGVERPVIVVGHGGELMQETLGEEFDYAWQREQLGTGHATLMAKEILNGHPGHVLITPGDTPLISAEVLSQLAEAHAASGAEVTVGVVDLADPAGYGRVVCDEQGRPIKIVEHRDATEREREIPTINTGIFCCRTSTLFELLPRVSNRNAQGEYYLTDLVAMAREEGRSVAAFAFDDPEVLAGVNDRWQLAECAKALRMRILKRHALNGVTIIDPDTTFVGPSVTIGVDTVLEPMTVLEGATQIGSGCRIGPNSRVKASVVGDGCTVIMSHLERARMEQGARCGPYANLRPGAVLGERVKVGNFVEVKNASLGTGSAVSHLSYIGDGAVGAGANIGAGTIFCNYDGFGKHRTEVGDGVFVGSNSTLVAPVTIGEGAIIAAGSVITSDVPAQALGIGRSRQEVKAEWAASWRKKKQPDQS
jgi:bifunctional UDP-N-acetylglucosamine pyrophosphorylase / glucosamine-1-phosphate N-acetyltransferase